MSTSRRLLSLTAGLALAAGGLAVTAAAPAQAVSTGLVIAEVYGGGGNSQATFNADFVELRNLGTTDIPLSGKALQYRSAAGTGGGVAALSGTVPAGSRFLVRVTNEGTTGAALPTPDLITTTQLAMSGENGQVFLLPTTTAYAGPANDIAGSSAVVDMVGYGTTPTTFEGAVTGDALSNQTSAQRDAGDTDNNAADFREATPTPANSGGGEPPPDPDPTEVTIPEIQGPGTASPLLGDPVIVRGVVTAAYPSGLFGFNMQTPGTGGPIDLATQGASDGLFVYYPFGTGSVTVRPGDHVEVTGTVDEFAGQTQVVIEDAATDVTVLDEPVDAVTAATTAEWPDADAEKEVLEGMLYTVGRDFTVTDTFATNQFGEVALALGDTPLIQPTEVADAQDAAAIARVEADNAARAIVLDDASSTNFTASSFNAVTCGTRPVPCLLNGGLTPPYVSNDRPVRVGAAATFTGDVIFSQGGSPSSPTYRFQPLSTVIGPGNAASPATFENTRTAAPDEALINADGTSDLKVTSFNVLNYFTTLGDPNDDNVGDGGCLAFNDRDGDGNTVRDGCDPRGAWDPQDLARQQQKIVAAINALDADVVGLMEIENSARLGETPDEATQALVAALNAAAGGDVWAANPSSTELPPTSEQDVINNAIIYKPASVTRVGEARALGELSGDGEAFGNAREPIAQVFAPVGGGEQFLAVVNHFKSKGSGADDGTGQGNANPDRVAQATALAAWVPTVQDDTDTDSVLLIGDFNAYTMEDPMQVLYGAGYDDSELVTGNDEYSYSFMGLSGSLDHILLNEAALESFTGSDIWNINSGESLALEYSRFNYHATDFHRAGPFRSSDHDPVVVGLDLVDEGEELLESTTTAETSPDRITVGKDRATVRVRVRADGVEPTGTVTAVSEGRTLDTATLVNGRATLRVGPFDSAGRKSIEVSYSGDDEVAPSSDRTSVRVEKARSRLTVDSTPKKVFADRTPVVLDVTVRADGVEPTGEVRVRADGQEYRAQLSNGSVQFQLPPFDKPGREIVTVVYEGSDALEGDRRELRINVRR